MQIRANPKLFYGYIVVAASMFILVLMHGTNSTYALFFSSLQTTFSADRATIAGASSLAFFFEGLFSIFHGRLTDALGPRKLITGSAIIFGLGFFLMSRINALWQLYLVYPLIVGIGVSSGNVALLATAARWFVKRRGLMTSVVKVGTGAGIFIMPLLATFFISSYGWRQAYELLAIIGVIGIILFAQFLRRDPAQMKLQPYGMYDKNGTAAPVSLGPQLGVKQVMRTRQFWIICVAYFIAWYATQSVMIHIVAYAVDDGISAASAAGVVSLIGGISIAGRLVMGGTGDRIGNKKAILICFVILIISLFWLQFTRGAVLLYLFAVVYGFAHGGFFAVMSPMIAELFGTASHGSNFGMVLFLSQAGGALGPLVTGRIFDVTGSYQIAFIILIAASIAALVLTSTIKPVQIKAPSGVKEPVTAR